jgi:WD40 repeat protein
MSRIFISYRRADSHAITDRIYEHLSAQFGTGTLFKDVDSIAIGDQFPLAIEKSIINCDVVLVIIGPRWAAITGEDGQRRLHDQHDFVRQEVETGLRHNKLVVPVLVESASMPSKDELPDSLKPLIDHNAVTIRNDPYFKEDVGRLSTGIVEHFRKLDPAYRLPVESRPGWLRIIRQHPRAAVGITMGVTGALVAAALLLGRGGDSPGDNSPPIATQDGQVQIVEPGTGVFFLPSSDTGQNHRVDDGEWISNGGTLTTFQGTVVRVNYALGAFSTVMPSAWVRLNNVADSSLRMAFTIENSELFVFTGEWPGAIVDTLNGARATVTGSEMWIADDQGNVTVACLSGGCTVADSTGKTRDLEAEYKVTFASGGGDLEDTTYSPEPILPADIDGYNRRCNSCIAVVIPPPVAGRVAFMAGGFFGASEDIFAVSTDGSDVAVLTQPDLEVSKLVWSPDGSQIAFAGRSLADPGMAEQIYVMDADGSDLVRLTDISDGARAPDWSPDGTKIVFEEQSNVSEIYVMDADGSNLIPLTDNRKREQWPVWSPDGNRIAFVLQSNLNKDIYVMEVDGWPRVNLTHSPGVYEDHPAWSPDGTRIAFASDRDGSSDIFVMNADGSDPINLTNNEAEDQFPVWLPDGQHIAFISNREESYYKSAYLMNDDGSGVVRLLSFWGQEPYPPGYNYVDPPTYLAWMPGGPDAVHPPAAPVSIPLDMVKADIVWRVLQTSWGSGASSNGAEVEVRLTDKQGEGEACSESATFQVSIRVSRDFEMQTFSAENVTFSEESNTFTVTLPGAFVSKCEPPEAALIAQQSECGAAASNRPDLADLARAQLLFSLSDLMSESLSGMEELATHSIKPSLTEAVGDNELVIVFDRSLAPAPPESCVPVVPEGWQYDPETETWEQSGS